MTVEKTIERAESEARCGRLWRAKEILSSSCVTYGYEPDLYRTLAEVLMKMGDDLEAGRFYLLCVASPTEKEKSAMDLYLSRNASGSYQKLMRKFPRKARLSRLDDYPAYVHRHLKSLGAPEDLRTFETNPRSKTETILGNALGFVGVALAAFLITCLLLGFRQILVWLFN